jgi:NIPSNAP protein
MIDGAIIRNIRGHHMHTNLSLIALITLLVLLPKPVQAEDTQLYEMRTYTTNDGKLNALHQRFKNHTMRIFEKHGIQNIGYWIPAEKPNTLIYIIAHDSSDAAKANWQAFVSDPEWQEVYAASIAEGRLVAQIDSVFMTKTPYSP